MTGAAIITGAANRIGRAIALRLAGDGNAVAVHYHQSSDDARETVRLICENGGTAVAVKADLRKEGQIGQLIDDAVGAFDQPLDILVNNASLFEEDDISTVSADSWASHMQVNLRAPLALSQRFAKVLASQDKNHRRGNIINLIDQRVWRLTPEFLSYTVSKSALWTLTQTLAQALAPDIRVNGIAPGPALVSKHQDKEAFQAEVRAVPLRRGPGTAEIANAAAFILGSPSMTGQLITLDGGQHLAWHSADPVASGGSAND